MRGSLTFRLRRQRWSLPSTSAITAECPTLSSDQSENHLTNWSSRSFSSHGKYHERSFRDSPSCSRQILHAHTLRLFSSSSPNSRVIYEGPLASATLRLKRVSVTTAFVGGFLMPMLLFTSGGGAESVVEQPQLIAEVAEQLSSAAASTTTATDAATNTSTPDAAEAAVQDLTSAISEAAASAEIADESVRAGGVPTIGRIAVAGTASMVAVGSTALLSYCVSPYVHQLERIPLDATPKNIQTDSDVSTTNHEHEDYLIRATTRDILARQVITEFNPATDVSWDNIGFRPFCNFVAKGVPMYVHAELLSSSDEDDSAEEKASLAKLKEQLLGNAAIKKEAEGKKLESDQKKDKKSEDDDLF